MFKIIKSLKKHKEKKSIYPFGDMDVGDAFIAPRDMGSYNSTDRRQRSILTCARSFSKLRGNYAKFSTTLVDDHRVLCRRVK